MEPTRELLLLAYGIGEFSSALDHLRAVGRAGHTVPWVVSGRIERDLRSLCALWWNTTHGDPLWLDSYTDRCVAEAREWITEHVVELGDLIAQQEEQKEDE